MKSPVPLLWFGMVGCLGAWLGCEFPSPPFIYPAVFLLLAVGALLLRGWPAQAALLLACLFAFAFYADARTHYFPSGHLMRGETAPRMAKFRVRALEDATLTVNSRNEERLEFIAGVLDSRDTGESRESSGKLRVLVREPGSLTVHYADELLVSGYLQPIEAPSGPGEFDAQGYYRNRGVFHGFLADPALTVKLSEGIGNPLNQLAVRLRRHMQSALGVGLEDAPETRALTAGILFGDKRAIPEKLKESFRVTGTQHIFAVSGFHVATILAVLLVTLELAGVVRWRWAWVVLPLLLVFCLATGMRPSAFRAFVMILLLASSWLLLRPVNVFNLLGLAALLLLAWEPGQILDTGFQLSFSVVFGMALGSGFLYRVFYAKLRPDPWIPRRLLGKWRLMADKGSRMFCATLATACMAWLASLPIMVLDFHMISPVTPLANMLVVPLACLVVTVSSLAVVLGWLWSFFPMLLNQVSWLVLKLMVLGVGFFAQLPGSHFYVGVSGVPKGVARFTFFKQEQLAPALLQVGGENWLIGTGKEELWNFNINPYRKSLGINSFDGVILPRGGVQAMGAGLAISDQARVKGWVENGFWGRTQAQRLLLERLAEKGEAKQFWRRGDEMVLGGGMRVEVLWPANDEVSANQNDKGLVLRFVMPGGSLLYAGNISKAVEKSLLASGDDLSADCLMQGQNSAGNLGRDWLLAVRPKQLIRPARGYFSDASLTAEFWQTVRELKTEVWRMEESGALVVELLQQGYVLRPYKIKSAD
ncbi:MAG: ComEC/Rec2 family competence protein [Verrucomicrobiales bacterium]|jgi:ComEC/Rec2-related protein|nr:ComEC/Rec2 family competence protein [Verrucomicrobiales bacterium]